MGMVTVAVLFMELVITMDLATVMFTVTIASASYKSPVGILYGAYRHTLERVRRIS